MQFCEDSGPSRRYRSLDDGANETRTRPRVRMLYIEEEESEYDQLNQDRSHHGYTSLPNYGAEKHYQDSDETERMPRSGADGTYLERTSHGFGSFSNSETEGTDLESTYVSEKHQPARSYRDSHSMPLGSGTQRRSKSSYEFEHDSLPRYASFTSRFGDTDSLPSWSGDSASLPTQPRSFDPKQRSNSSWGGVTDSPPRYSSVPSRPKNYSSVPSRPKDYSSVSSRPGHFDPRHRSRSCSNLDELRRAVEHLYRNYHQCRQCGSKDLVQVKDKRGAILLVSCNNCSHGFGVDDHMEPDIILELYRQGCLEVHVGCCSNTDPDQFEIVRVEGVKLWVRCMQCEMVSVMDEGEDREGNGAGQWRQWRDGDERKEGWGGGEGAEDSDGRDELGALVCPCGNRDQDNLSVVVFGEEVRCIICDICQETINFPEALRPESNSPGVTDSQENTHDPSEFVSCKCPPTQKKITIRYDESGSPEIIACANCQFFYLPKDPPQKKSKAQAGSFRKSQSMPGIQSSSSGKSTWESWFRSKVVPMLERGIQSVEHAIKGGLRVSYREVRQIGELRPGDHVMWDRREGYKHHAIVETVTGEADGVGCRGTIGVVHYNGPSPRSRKIKGEIVKEELDPFEKNQGRLFLVDYSTMKADNPSSVLSADEVLCKANSKLGEVEYSLLLNNCEHFATWCKTGLHVSSQVMDVLECVKKYGKASYDVAKAIPMREVLGQALQTSGTAAATESTALKALGMYGGVVFAVVMAGRVFVVDCVNKIQKANEDRRKGDLSRDAYLEVVAKSVGGAVLGLAGMAGCTALGVTFGVPLWVAVIGGTLGGMICKFGGQQIGALAFKECKKLKKRFGLGI